MTPTKLPGLQPDERTCRFCGYVGPSSDFASKGYHRNGDPHYTGRCRPCQNADMRRWRNEQKTARG